MLQKHFFNRTDRLAFKPPWDSDACPADGDERLTGYLKAHISKHHRTKIRWTSKNNPQGGETKTGNWRIGTYGPAPDGTTGWLVLDFDGSNHAVPLTDPAAAALFVYRLCWSLGLPCYLERSKSGSGWHLWIFFDPPITAKDARALGFVLVPDDFPLTDGRFADASKGLGVEVFPKADDLRGKTVGNQVWLPWYIGAAQGGNAFYRPMGGRGLVPYIPEEFLTATAEQVTAARLKLREQRKEAASAEAADHASEETPAANGHAENNGQTSNRRSPFVGKATGTGDWKTWRAEALKNLKVRDVYDDVLTGKEQGNGWLEARDPWSPTGDRHPSAGVADDAEGVERGRFKSFRAGGFNFSVFDYLTERGRATDFRDAQRIIAELTGVPLPARPQAKSTTTAEGSEAEEEPDICFALEWIDSETFFAGDYRPEWIVKKLCVANQPGFCGGATKSLKTSLVLDLALSLGSATPFLGKFEVPKRLRVGMLSGESGHFTLQETARRIAAAKGINPSHADICWEFRMPQLANEAHLAVLAGSLRKEAIKVLIFDPLYLSLLSGVEGKGLQAANLFDIGPLLLSVTQACLDNGTMPLLVHHTRKTLTDPYAPLELQDLAFSGCAEFARQWLLVNRREKYEPGSGQHRLWVNVGGSAGQSALIAVDVDEGELQEDFSGRTWAVSIADANVAREQAEEGRESRKAEQQAKKVRKDGTKILNALQVIDPDREGVAKNRLRQVTALGGERLNVAIAALLEEEQIEVIEGTAKVGNGAKRATQLIRRVRVDSNLKGKAV
jgi:replicative DNA helicase